MTVAVTDKVLSKIDTQRKTNVTVVLKRWLHNYRSRQLLAGLDRSQLKDIGITRGDALQEIRKPFWK